MRKLLFIIVLFFSSSVFGVTYYCYEEDKVGFDRDKKNEKENFDLLNYTFDIDFENKKVTTLEKKHKYLGFNDIVDTKCEVYKEDEIYCINVIGSAFSFNKQTLRFKLANIINTQKNRDDDIISYGNCSTTPRQELAFFKAD